MTAAPSRGDARAPAAPRGSRFLYEPFRVPALGKADLLERVMEERERALEARLDRIETTLERLDRRLWLAVFGVVAVILTEAVQGLLAAQAI